MPTYAESKLAPEHYGFPIWQTQLLYAANTKESPTTKNIKSKSVV